jgi:hypothetical protein
MSAYEYQIPVARQLPRTERRRRQTSTSKCQPLTTERVTTDSIKMNSTWGRMMKRTICFLGRLQKPTCDLASCGSAQPHLRGLGAEINEHAASGAGAGRCWAAGLASAFSNQRSLHAASSRFLSAFLTLASRHDARRGHAFPPSAPMGC